MRVCENLEPKKVFEIFEDICAIPHGSKNTKQISDYCVAFAKERNLQYQQDAVNNVIIWKPGTKGYEQAEPIIIQGHMDMVCEKEADRDIDFSKEGLKLYIDGDFLRAEGTTLGGDDGIAIAYAFALLDSTDLPHPPLEVVLTVDEEVGMDGAEAIDLSGLKGRKLLNIDSDEEGIFLSSCAGGMRVDCEIPVSYTQEEGKLYEITIQGLLGGHSGGEIHKERGNAIILIGRVLKAIQDEMQVNLHTLQGGLMDNAIPREAKATMVLEEEQKERFLEIVAEQRKTLQKEYKKSDMDVSITVKEKESGSYAVLASVSLIKVLFFLRNTPYGVQNRSMDIAGLVETSLNPGIMKLKENVFGVSYALRSSVTSRKYDMADRLKFLTEFLGGEVNFSGDYPAWEYKANSTLRNLMCKTYTDLFGKEPQIQAIHAGLECGILSGKLDNLDCISFGPNNYDIHTPQERLSISSTQRVWRLLVEFMKRAK